MKRNKKNAIPDGYRTTNILKKQEFQKGNLIKLAANNNLLQICISPLIDTIILPSPPKSNQSNKKNPHEEDFSRTDSIVSLPGNFNIFSQLSLSTIFSSVYFQ